MITELLRRVAGALTRRPSDESPLPTPHGAVPAATAVGIIDTTVDGMGKALVSILDRPGMPARMATPLELLAGFHVLVVLAPLGRTAPSDTGVVLIDALDHLQLEPELSQAFTSAIVIIWVVEAQDRARYAVANDGRNYVRYLLGTGWRRQLATAGGDARHAALVRSRSVARIACSTTDSDFNTQVVENLVDLDSSLIHALVCRHPSSTEPGGVLEWDSAVAGIAARIQLRWITTEGANA
ncbi:hypothetical protein AB0L82_36285 [Nocardia sp. NPDC052001]|uniref:hypothetical protein n=1 Tax=Nocardia sp. NPDC052001 TaxID=3154853 RepID=UPI00343A5BAB